MEAIEHLPSQKRIEELEAKVSSLQEKSKKATEELKEEKELHRKAVDKLNLSLAFNQKLEAYVGNTEDVVNKVHVASLPVPLSLDPLILTSKHHKHQPYTCHAHLGLALNLLPWPTNLGLQVPISNP